MAGALIEVTIDDGGVQETLNLIAQRVKNLKPAMKIIGKLVTDPVKENFRAGGVFPASEGMNRKHNGYCQNQY